MSSRVRPAKPPELTSQINIQGIRPLLKKLINRSKKRYDLAVYHAEKTSGLLIGRCRRIAAVLLLCGAKELVLCVERIAANGVTLTTAGAILQLVAGGNDLEKPDWSVSELLCSAGQFSA